MILVNPKTLEEIDLGELGFFVHSKRIDATPEVKAYESDVIFGVKRKMSTELLGRHIEVKLVVNSTSLFELNELFMNLNKIFREKTYDLIFKTNESVYYKDVSLVDTITSEQLTINSHIFTLRLYSYDGNVYSYNNFEESLTTSSTGALSLYSNGVSTIYPFIFISGIYESISLSLEGRTMKLKGGSSGPLYIDNENMLIYTESSGKKVNELKRWSGTFIQLEKESSVLSISVTGGSAEVKVSYEIPKY